MSADTMQLQLVFADVAYADNHWEVKSAEAAAEESPAIELKLDDHDVYCLSIFSDDRGGEDGFPLPRRRGLSRRVSFGSRDRQIDFPCAGSRTTGDATEVFEIPRPRRAVAALRQPGVVDVIEGQR